jgi:hypothetical protein
MPNLVLRLLLRLSMYISLKKFSKQNWASLLQKTGVFIKKKRKPDFAYLIP